MEQHFTLRPFQVEALQAIDHGRDVICIAGTGSGKSLIFQRWAKEPGRRIVLISPLIALQNQQRLLLEETDFRILSPESLLREHIVSEIREWSPGLVVVDECHCIFEWGEHFRPSFSKIPDAVLGWNPRASLWLTATLPKADLDSLKGKLRRPQIIGEFEPSPNIELSLLRLGWPERPGFLQTWVRSHQSSGVIFVLSREDTARVARLLEGSHRKILRYHAGMSREERALVEHLVKEDGTVVVATSAFGMGIHIQNLEWVILFQPYPSLLAITQALGRVGRGSSLNQALVLWHEEDFRTLGWMASSERGQSSLRQVQEFLNSKTCRLEELKKYFNSTQNPNPTPCLRCDWCRRREDGRDVIDSRSICA